MSQYIYHTKCAFSRYRVQGRPLKTEMPLLTGQNVGKVGNEFPTFYLGSLKVAHNFDKLSPNLTFTLN